MNSYFKHIFKNTFIFSTIFLLIVFLIGSPVKAQDYSTLEKGTYIADAQLSCFVNAIGGINFEGGGFFDNKVTLIIDEDDNKSMKINFATGNLTIMGTIVVTFINPNPANDTNNRGVTPGTIGIYGQDGETIITQWVFYAASSQTAQSATEGTVNYIDYITFPLSYDSDTYNLTLFLDSQVMGLQFTDPNTQATASTYSAIVIIDWDSLLKIDETSTVSSNVVYSLNNGYEVVIPATITIDSATKTDNHEVEAKNLTIGSDAYVTVNATKNSSLSNGSNTVNFTNVLGSGILKNSGDKLSGTVP